MIEGIKAVIFDLDGVLTDTSALHTQAWKRMTDEEKIPFDPVLVDELRGVSRRRSLELILGHANLKYGYYTNFTSEVFDALMDRKNFYYVESLVSITPDDIAEGGRELIDYLKEKGYKVAMGSSSKNAIMVIANLGIKDDFDAIVDGTEISYSKPHPEIFQKVADKLGIPYEQCAVVEDATAGVESAKNAGMVSIGIGPESRFTGEGHWPDYRYDDLGLLNSCKEELFG